MWLHLSSLAMCQCVRYQQVKKEGFAAGQLRLQGLVFLLVFCTLCGEAQTPGSGPGNQMSAAVPWVGSGRVQSGRNRKKYTFFFCGL